MTTQTANNGTQDASHRDNAKVEGYIVKNEVARRLQKTPRTVERWMREGIIPHIKVGKGSRATVLFSWPQIEAHLASRFGIGGN
jgi:hypothetical protein